MASAVSRIFIKGSEGDESKEFATMMTLELVKEHAMKLTEAEREQLAEELIYSLPAHDDDDEELKELMRRDAELDANPALGMTHQELMASLGR